MLSYCPLARWVCVTLGERGAVAVESSPPAPSADSDHSPDPSSPLPAVKPLHRWCARIHTAPPRPPSSGHPPRLSEGEGEGGGESGYVGAVRRVTRVAAWALPALGEGIEGNEGKVRDTTGAVSHCY